MTVQQTLDRLRAEFLEMPGLRLTASQIQRLCGIDQPTCATALDRLVDVNFLCTKPDGTYARLTDGAIRHQRTAKAGRLAQSRTRGAA
jgi:hypothetical protein